MGNESSSFTLTFKDYGSEYLPETGIVGEVDKIGNTQNNNSDVYVLPEMPADDVAQISTHEKSHELGLVHANDQDNLMYPYYSEDGKNELTQRQLKTIIKKTLNPHCSYASLQN